MAPKVNKCLSQKSAMNINERLPSTAAGRPIPPECRVDPGTSQRRFRFSGALIVYNGAPIKGVSGRAAR